MTVAVALFAACIGLAAHPANARVFVGIGIPFPGFYPAPYYYPPPPVYYPPPPVVYAPPPQVYAPPPPIAMPTGSGQSCYAGPYACPMDRPVATGSNCYCPGNGGQRVWGRAN
jgi:hypothetical protein